MFYSRLRISWIFLLILDSICFLQIVGLQGEPLYFPSLSIRWVKGVMAERNDVENHDGVEVLERKFNVNYGAMTDRNDVQNHEGIILKAECSLQRNSKPFNIKVQDEKCNSSFHRSFLQLLMLICLPQSGSKLKPKPRYRVLNEEHDAVSGNNLVDTKDAIDTEAPENGSENGSVYLMTPVGVSVQSMPRGDERINDEKSFTSLSSSIPQDEVENGGQQKKPVDESAKVVNGSDTASDSSPVVPKDELSSEAPQAGRKINKTHISTLNLSNIQVRQEPGDGLYNYASDSKGAKILAANKEAKGASSILNRDKDKYLRTPCSAENKYFDLELSEETLIISIAIANHEFYSSTVRQFELWGSLVYPTEEWVFLGMFEAENIRTMQMFKLNEPKWVRYLRTRMLNHYGSDFYCTLSVLEVHGVDAIEWLLEDWIAEEASSGSGILGAQGKGILKSVQLSSKVFSEETVVEKNSYLDVSKSHDITVEIDDDDDELLEVKSRVETYNFKDINTGDTSKPVYHQTTRPALDSVMKLLMQKVRSLEHNQPLVSHYIQELSNRYKEASKGFNRDLTHVNNKLDAAIREVENLRLSIDEAESRWVHEKLLMQENLEAQLRRWSNDMDLLRSHLKSTEVKGMVALTVALFSTVGVIALQIMSCCLYLVRMLYQNKKTMNNNPPPAALWIVPFLSCVIVVFVLSL